jgi:Putative Flp pilus-assembly TadE/G-like
MKPTKGQTMIVFAICLIALLSLVALGLDGANAFFQRRIAQKSADSASMGATQLLATRGGNGNATLENQVLQVVNRLAGANGADLKGQAFNTAIDGIDAYFLNSAGTVVGTKVGTNGGVPSTAVGVRAVVRRQSPAMFAQVIGIDQVQATAKSDAEIFQAGSADYSPGGGLLPIGVPQTVVNTTAPYDLWTPQNDFTGGSQYKGLLDYDSVTGAGYINDPADDSMNKPGAENYWSSYGYKGRIAKDNDVALVNGDLGHNVSSGLDFYIDNHAKYDNPMAPTANTKYAIVYVPIYQYPFAETQPSGTIHVIGFAAFKIYQKDVSSSSATGTWVSYVNLDGIPSGNLTSPTTYRGPVTIRMGDD